MPWHLLSGCLFSGMKLSYICFMDVSIQSTSLSQLTILHTVALQSQKMAMDSAKNEGKVVMQMISDLASITDTALGGGVDVLA